MDSQYGRIYEDLYRRHWWFRVRERIIVSVLHELGLRRPASILDVGCGNGLLFPALEPFGHVQGIEIDRFLVPADSPYRDQIHGEPLGHSRYAGSHFDLITALDVIEHIEDDAAAVRSMLQMLAPGGRLLITVPASTSLWDEHDRINHHYRRYSAAQLGQLLCAAGAKARIRYLFHALYLPKWIVATRNRILGSRVGQHRIPVPLVNRAAETAFWLEYQFMNLPFGTSLLAVASKEDNGRCV